MPLRDLHRVEARNVAKSTVDCSGADRPGADSAALAGGEPEYLCWGGGESPEKARQVLATLGAVELEYAAIRNGAALVDAAARAVIRCEGEDAQDLLNRLTTRKLDDLAVGEVRSTFFLTRTGRILSEFNVVRTESAMLIDVDCTDVEPLLAAIDHHVFSEDVQVAVDEDGYTLELHGPDAERVLGACASVLPDLGRSNAGVIAGRPIRCTRNDVLGVPGVRIHVHREDAAAIWETLHARGRAVVTRCRTAGWYAVNIARVEAASPWWHVDYGPTTVPHETGLLQSHVDFDKGCYPGQEVVARMEYLGNPKQILRRIIVADERLPIAGGQIFGGDDASLGDPIGVITSSSPAPMRGNQAVAMGMVKWSSAAVGTPVRLVAEGAAVRGTIEEIEVPE